jgi:peroxiredoxin
MTTPQSNFRKNLVKTLVPLAAILGVAIGILVLSRAPSDESHFSGDGHDHGISEIEIGQTFPDIKLTTLEGTQQALSAFTGKVLVLNLWATWCEACMVEMPSLQKLNESLHPQGLEVWALSLDEEYKTEVPPVVKKLGLELPVFIDPGQELANTLNVEMIPITYIIEGKTLKLLAVEEGERDWASDSMTQKLQSYLQPTSDPVE